LYSRLGPSIAIIVEHLISAFRVGDGIRVRFEGRKNRAFSAAAAPFV